MKSIFDYTVIADFLSPSSRDRIIYELSSPKKRTKAFERFSHDIDSILDPALICFKGTAISEALMSEIKKVSVEGMVFSFKYQEGRSMSISEAFDYLSYEASAVLVLIENWLVIKPEHEGGEGSLYVLRKK